MQNIKTMSALLVTTGFNFVGRCGNFINEMRTIVGKRKELVILFLVACFFGCAEKDQNPLSSGNNQTNTNLKKVDTSLVVYSRMVDSLMPKIESIRGLKFLRPVSVARVACYPYSTDTLIEDSVSYYPPEYGDMTLELRQLGLIPDSMENIYESMYSFYSNVLAYYMPGTDSIFLCNPESSSAGDLRSTIVHELTHALQDQHFNLLADRSPWEMRSRYNTDYWLTNTCVTEGEATLCDRIYYNTYEESAPLSREQLRDRLNTELDWGFSELTGQNPPLYWTLYGYSPYIIGTLYIDSLQTAGGWDRVAGCYNGQRPLSTAEILSARSFEPVDFDFSSIAPLLCDSTVYLNYTDDDNLGPILLAALFSGELTLARIRASLGWRGDRLLYIHSDNATYGRFVWALSFDTDSSASWTASAICNVLEKRNLGGVAWTKTTTQGGDVLFSDGLHVSCVTHSKTRVVWYENISADKRSQISTLLANKSLGKTNGLNNDRRGHFYHPAWIKYLLSRAFGNLK